MAANKSHAKQKEDEILAAALKECPSCRRKDWFHFVYTITGTILGALVGYYFK